MMNSNQQPAPINANEEQNFIISSLASQFQMTQEETQLVISIVQQPDPSLELLKHPKVTELIKQRKGRWVQEEEDYANFLSHEFFLGVADLENGITKRAYLSGKLTCTKMRISKKFKGKNTGKEVFVRKARTAEGRDITPYEIQWYKSRHVELEKKFLKAVLKSVLKWGVKNAQKKAIKAAKQAVASAQPFKPLPSCPHPVMQPSINVVQLANAPCVVANISAPPIDGIGCAQEAKVAPLAPSPNILIHGKFNGTAFESSVSIQPNLGTNNNCTTQIGPGSVVMQAPTIQQDLNPNGLVNLSKPTIPCVNQPNPNIVSSVTTAAPCGFEIQVNTNAGFDQNNVSTLPMSAVDNRGKFAGSSQVPAFNIDQNATTGLDTYFDIQNNFPAPVPINEGLKRRNISELVGPLDYRFTPMNAGGGKPHAATASHAVSTSASEPSSNDESENVSSSNEASSYSNYMSKPDNAFKSDEFYHNNNDNIPDLLSGFDKHVASTKRSNATVKVDLPENRPIPEDSHLFAGAGCVAESPYITSKSFDDLHQFLGKGLSTTNMMPNLDLNQNNVGNTFQQVNNNGTYHKPAAGANHSIVLSNQMGLPPSHGAAFPPGMAQVSQLPQMPQIPTHSGPQFFHLADGRQSSISNTSDLTTSD